jgi:hypothetical protein
MLFPCANPQVTERTMAHCAKLAKGLIGLSAPWQEKSDDPLNPPYVGIFARIWNGLETRGQLLLHLEKK